MRVVSLLQSARTRALALRFLVLLALAVQNPAGLQADPLNGGVTFNFDGVQNVDTDPAPLLSVEIDSVIYDDFIVPDGYELGYVDGLYNPDNIRINQNGTRLSDLIADDSDPASIAAGVAAFEDLARPLLALADLNQYVNLSVTGTRGGNPPGPDSLVQTLTYSTPIDIRLGGFVIVTERGGNNEFFVRANGVGIPINSPGNNNCNGFDYLDTDRNYDNGQDICAAVIPLADFGTTGTIDTVELVCADFDSVDPVADLDCGDGKVFIITETASLDVVKTTGTQSAVGPDGTFDQTFTIDITNDGSVDVLGLSAIDDIEGIFGDQYDPANGLVNGPTITLFESPTGSSLMTGITANASYNGDDAGGDADLFSFGAGTIFEPGDSVRITFTVTLDATEAASAMVTNDVVVSGSNIAGPFSVIISSSEVPNPPATGITLVKSVSSVTDSNNNGIYGDVGDIVNFSFTAQNTGTVALADITVSDADLLDLDGAFTLFQPADGFDGDLAVDEGPVEVATARYILAASDIDVGFVRNTADVIATAVETDVNGDPVPDVALVGVDPAIDDSDAGSDPTINQVDGSTSSIDNPEQVGTGDDPTLLNLPTPLPSITLVQSVASVEDTNNNGIFGDAGDTVNYTYTVENTGDTSLADVTIDNDGFDGLTGISSFTADPDFDGDLATDEGEVLVATGTYVITPTDVETGEISTQPTVTSFAVATDTTGDPLPDVRLVGLDPVIDTSDAGTEPALDRATGDIIEIDDPATDRTNADPTVLLLQSAGDYVLTKSASVDQVLIGQTLSYEIIATSLTSEDFAPATIVDTLPQGMVYTPGTATVDGVSVEPEVAGSKLIFSDVSLPGNGEVTIIIQTRVLSSAPAGSLVNTVELIDQLTGEPLTETASAVVMRTVEAVFDCTHVIGKVFDDVNMDGYQDQTPDISATITNQEIFVDKLGNGGKLTETEIAPQTEVGIPNVRLVTPSGTIITTDAFGRYSVPCAEIPEGIGSNFMLKLDTRTLPTGYRVTTENPRVMRLTSGMMTEMNFGAALGQVFDIDLSGQAYVGTQVEPSANLVSGVDTVMARIAETPTVIRISYYRGSESAELAHARLDAIAHIIQEQWRDIGSYRLLVEKTVMQLQ